MEVAEEAQNAGPIDRSILLAAAALAAFLASATLTYFCFLRCRRSAKTAVETTTKQPTQQPKIKKQLDPTEENLLR